VGKEIFKIFDFPVESNSKPTDETLPLPSNIENNLKELIASLEENNISSTFLLLPCIVSEDDRKLFNTVKAILDEHEIPYLDLLDKADEIGLDYSHDFYDKKHLNVYGMEKSTHFLAKYLKETYDLPDHRGDANYANWDAAYDVYISQMNKFTSPGAVRSGP
jgi:hypothetical protein